MNRIILQVGIITIALLFFVGCKKTVDDTTEKPTNTTIVYPATGQYGNNILSEQITSLTTGVAYSMIAEVPKDANLSIVIKGGMWFYGSPINWLATEYDDDTKSQTFSVTHLLEKSADLSIEFDDKEPLKKDAYITIEYYENKANNPTKVKKMNFNH